MYTYTYVNTGPDLGMKRLACACIRLDKLRWRRSHLLSVWAHLAKIALGTTVHQHGAGRSQSLAQKHIYTHMCVCIYTYVSAYMIFVI